MSKPCHSVTVHLRTVGLLWNDSVISPVIAILHFNSSSIEVGNIPKDTINMVLDKSLNQMSHMSFLPGHLTDFEITRTKGYSPATDRAILSV